MAMEEIDVCETPDLFSKEIICPHCGVELEASFDDYGKMSECPNCGKGFLLSRNGEPLFARGLGTTSRKDIPSDDEFWDALQNRIANKQTNGLAAASASGTKDIKSKLIIALRWVGAAILPVPVAIGVRVLVLYVMPSSVCSYVGCDGQWWFVFLPYICPFLEGSISIVCSYSLAPRSKFFATSIIATVYSTIWVVSFLYGIFLGTFHIKTAITGIIFLAGLGCGLLQSYRAEHGIDG